MYTICIKIIVQTGSHFTRYKIFINRHILNIVKWIIFYKLATCFVCKILMYKVTTVVTYTYIHNGVKVQYLFGVEVESTVFQ